MNKRKRSFEYSTKRLVKRKTIPRVVHARSGFGGPSLRGIIGAPNGLYNQRFGQRQERKFLDKMFPETLASDNTINDMELFLPVSGTSTPSLLNGIAEGTDYVNRVGRNVTMKSLYFQGMFAIDPTGASHPEGVVTTALDGTLTSTTATYNAAVDVIRILIVYDLQTNGSAPPMSDVLYSNYISGGDIKAGLPDTLAFMNLNYRDRFKIVMDKRIVVSSNMNNGIVYVKKFKKLNSGVTFTSTSTGESGSSVGSIATGALFMYTFSQFGKAAGLIRTRLRFTDV